MINWYKNLDVFKKSCLVTLLTTLIAFLGCIPLYFNNLGEIPNAIIVSGTIFSLSFLLYEVGKNSPGLGITIFTNVVRFLLIIGLLFVSVFLYYKLEVKLFNVFAVGGTFLASVVIFVIINCLEGKNEGNSPSWFV